MAAALALAAAVGGSAVASSSADDHAGPADLVFGSATNEFPTPVGPGSDRLDVLAFSGPAGENPGGFVHAVGTTGLPMGAFEVAGPVTCVRVEGNKAAIKYRFDQASGSAATFKGGGVEVFIEDNGNAVDANAAGPPQTAAVFAAAATQCDDPALAAYDTVNSGDYTVIDQDGGSVDDEGGSVNDD
jgi:hypothetical protein